MRILMVDDDVTITLMFQRLIRNIGNVTVMNSSITALDELENLDADQWYDVILLDIMMPVMNGIEMIGELRKMEQQKPVLKPACIIMTSALCDTDQVIEAFEEGANDYLVKPISKDAFTAKLKSLGLLQN